MQKVESTTTAAAVWSAGSSSLTPLPPGKSLTGDSGSIGPRTALVLKDKGVVIMRTYTMVRMLLMLLIVVLINLLLNFSTLNPTVGTVINMDEYELHTEEKSNVFIIKKKQDTTERARR